MLTVRRRSSGEVSRRTGRHQCFSWLDRISAFNAGTSITLTVSNGRMLLVRCVLEWRNKTKTCTFTLNANASVNS